ncbi:hypothetical protein D3C77_458490 [compost metagenome]
MTGAVFTVADQVTFVFGWDNGIRQDACIGILILLCPFDISLLVQFDDEQGILNVRWFMILSSNAAYSNKTAINCRCNIIKYLIIPKLVFVVPQLVSIDICSQGKGGVDPGAVRSESRDDIFAIVSFNDGKCIVVS